MSVCISNEKPKVERNLNQSILGASKEEKKIPGLALSSVIEATSILDYDDTDTISSRRQTPIIPLQSQLVTSQPVSPYGQAAIITSSPPVVMCSQPVTVVEVSSVDRPSSPTPSTSKVLHRTYTSIQVMEHEDIPMIVH